MLAPGVAFLALWSVNPAGPTGYVLVPWITASLLAVPLASRERTRWLVIAELAILAPRGRHRRLGERLDLAARTGHRPRHERFCVACDRVKRCDDIP